MNEKSEKYIYVLMLRDYKFYIGQSANPDSRIRKQFDGKGSAWTKLYPPVEVILLNQLAI